MKNEPKIIRELFGRLTRATLSEFPKARGTLEATKEQGVYVIYSPSGRVLHVRRTPKARGGIAQRLRHHLHAASSFTIKYLKGDGSRLRRGYAFRALAVKKPRERALLEAYAIGRLCPAHIGHGSGGPITPDSKKVAAASG